MFRWRSISTSCREASITRRGAPYVERRSCTLSCRHGAAVSLSPSVRVSRSIVTSVSHRRQKRSITLSTALKGIFLTCTYQTTPEPTLSVLVLTFDVYINKCVFGRPYYRWRLRYTVSSVVCDVLYCGETVRPAKKLSEGVNKKPASKS